MIPNFLAQTLFGKREEELKKAISTWHDLISSNFIDEFKKRALQTEALIECLGKHSFTASLDPKKVIESMEANNYNSRIGYGMFMTGEKYDDVRGLMLAIVEEYNRTYKENQRLEVINKELETRISAITSAACPDYEVVKSQLSDLRDNYTHEKITRHDD